MLFGDNDDDGDGDHIDDWIDEALKRGEGFKSEEEKAAYLKSIGLIINININIITNIIDYHYHQHQHNHNLHHCHHHQYQHY